jgi:addiction module HigA family antidote
MDTIKRQVAPMSAGATLKHIELADTGLSQEQIADKLGITRKHLSAILNDRSPLTVPLALQIEREFGISADVLMRVEINHQLYVARQQSAA